MTGDDPIPSKRMMLARMCAVLITELLVPTVQASLVAPQASVEDGVGDPCHFEGRVVDEHGRPVPGATVVHLPDVRTLAAMGIVFGIDDVMQFPLAQQARFARATCAADGRFALDARLVGASDPEGSTWLWTRDPSLVVIQPGCALRAHLCAGFSGGDYDAGDIAIEPGCRLVGRVVDERGEPVGTARIHVCQDTMIRPVSATTADDRGSARLAEQLLGATTDSSGGFAIEGLWNGSVLVQVSAPDHPFADLGIEACRSGATTDCGQVRLADGEVLTGHVVDAQSQPVAGARVFAHARTAEEDVLIDGGEADVPALVLGCLLHHGHVGELTDAAGKFSLRGLDNRQIDVVVDAAGFDIALLSDVLPGSDPVVKVVPEATCEVDVVDAGDGRPLNDATVTAQRCPVFGHAVELRVDSIAGREGSFRVHQVSAGLTGVRVTAPGRGSMLLRPMSAVPGSVEHRTAQLAASGRISGRVVEGDHVPVRGVTVDARAVQPNSDGDVRVPRDSQSGDDSEGRPVGPKSIATDADGRFAFDGLAPGRWKLIVRTDRYDRPDTDPECELDAGRTVEVPDIHLDRGGVLSGYLRDEQGRPIAGRELFVVPKEQAARVTKFPVRRTRTDVEGRYEFPRLERGDWAVIDQEGGGTPLGQAFVGWHDRVQLDLTARG